VGWLGVRLSELASNFSTGNETAVTYEEGTTTSSALVITVLIKSLFIGVLCILVALWCRNVFRFGNRALHKLEQGVIGTKLAHSLWALSWLANFALYAVSLWLSVAYGRTYDDATTDAALKDWLIGTVVTWLLIEPVQALAIIMLPCVFKTTACDKAQEWLSCCGLDLSFFF